MADSRQLIKVAHSPDSDDAFMFYALANDKIDTGAYRFEHTLVDIESLNQRAMTDPYYELTAVSLHAYGFLSDKYLLCNCGASMGDNYGPMVLAKQPMSKDELRRSVIAVPGLLTTAFLSLELYLGGPFHYVLVPFEQIMDVVAAGEYNGQKIDAGLIIHEGQLTYAEKGLIVIEDMGKWRLRETGLPLPLGANAIRRDLGPAVIADVVRLLKESIQYGLDHRNDALDYALKFARGLDRKTADDFVGMYVNDWTLDFGPRGRESVARLLEDGYKCGALKKLVIPEFV